MITEQQLIEVGFIAKLHGLKGEMQARITDSVIDEVEHCPYLVCELDGIYVPFSLMLDDEKHVLGQVVDVHNLAYRAQGLVNELIADEFKVFLDLFLIMLLFFGREALAVEV